MTQSVLWYKKCSQALQALHFPHIWVNGTSYAAGAPLKVLYRKPSQDKMSSKSLFKCTKLNLYISSWWQVNKTHFLSLLYWQLTQLKGLHLQDTRHEVKWPQCHVFLSCSHQCPLIWKRKRTHPISYSVLIILACLHGTISFLSLYSFHLQASINFFFTIGA